jgi:hypothetical protein
MVRNLSEEEQLALYRELKARPLALEVGDQRKSTRKKFFKDILFTSSRGGHHEFIRDISETGVFIETPIPFTEGETLTITFPLKTGEEHIRVHGQIVRKTDVGIGIRFHPIDKAKSTLLKNLLESL